MRWQAILVPLLLIAVAAPASAGIFFGRKKKPQPTERVPELVTILKADGDENKRLEAVDELRGYDPSAYPMIVPTLIEALLNDRKPAVRAEAAQSLGRMRPVSQEAGQALEQALHNDPSMRVRLQARSSLLQYHWSGYHSSKDAPPIDAATRPDSAGPEIPPAISNTNRQPGRLTPQPTPILVNKPRTSPITIRPSTQEPPLAPETAPPPPPSPAPSSPPASRPLPAGPKDASPPPAPSGTGDGPSLEPPGGN
jgi:hypothetical protein